MKFEILGKPDYAIIKVQLDDNESILAESGAMTSMSSNVEIQTAARGGVFESLKRKVFSGESIFQNTFTAKNGKGELFLTAPTQGDIVHRKLNGEDIILSRGAYVAGSPELKIDSKWGGFSSFFSGEGLMYLRVSGVGDLFFASFGAVEEINVSGDYIVDTGHIVGFESTLNYNIEKVGGLKSLFLSGEGIVCRFSGRGKVYIQTRNQNSFAYWADSWRQVKSRSN